MPLFLPAGVNPTLRGRGQSGRASRNLESGGSRERFQSFRHYFGARRVANATGAAAAAELR